MSTSAMIVEAKRAGFVAGAQAATKGRWSVAKQRASVLRAIELFPMPTFVRPRVIRTPNNNPSTRSRFSWVEHRVLDGKLEYRMPPQMQGGAHARYGYGQNDRVVSYDNAWKPQWNTTEESLHAMLDLFANPTETVEVA
jgi:hypothetical protein